MALSLIGSSTALFPRLGRFAKAAALLCPTQAALQTLLLDILARYTLADETVTGSLAQRQDSLNRGLGSSVLSSYSSVAIGTLARMVELDEPTRTADPVAELQRQLRISGDTVARCTVSAAITVGGSNVGDGVLLIETKRGDGLTQENIIAEVGRIGVTSANGSPDRVQFVGVPSSASQWDWDWPQGSGQTTNLTTVSPTSSSLLANGGFDSWSSATVMPSWTLTNVTQEATTLYGGVGLAATVAAGVTGTLLQAIVAPTLNSIGFGLRLRGSAALGGTMTVALVDGIGTVLVDDQGVASSVALSLTGIGSGAWVSRTGTLRTPRIPPASMRIRLTAAPTGGALILDYLSAARLQFLYDGGPGMAYFAGATGATDRDTWTVTTTNNRASATYGLTWQNVFNRLMGTSILLPSSNSPTILDSLITS